MPHGARHAAPPALSKASRINRNLLTLMDQVPPHTGAGPALERGPATSSLLTTRGSEAAPSHAGERAEDIMATRRVLRHLQRLDQSVLDLRRPLGIPARTTGRP